MGTGTQADAVYCARCGARFAATLASCPACGAVNLAAGRTTPPGQDAAVSDRSYGVAVSLCGIFGIVGIHHFYLGNHLHGLFDLGLFLAAMACFFLPGAEDADWVILGVLLLAVDVLHTLIIFYRLITGQAHDGQGRKVVVPGGHP